MGVKRRTIIYDNAYIYEIKNNKSNKYYIGSTVNPQAREYAHFNDLRNNKHCNRHMQHSYNLYGEEAFEFEVILEVDFEYRFEEEASMIEEYIDLFGSNFIYNHILNPHKKDCDIKLKKMISDGYKACDICGNLHKLKRFCSLECKNTYYDLMEVEIKNDLFEEEHGYSIEYYIGDLIDDYIQSGFYED